jgi:hypothetical protein
MSPQRTVSRQADITSLPLALSNIKGPVRSASENYLLLEADSDFSCIYSAYIASKNNKTLHNHFCSTDIRPNFIRVSLQMPFRYYQITNTLIGILPFTVLQSVSRPSCLFANRKKNLILNMSELYIYIFTVSLLSIHILLTQN